MRAALRSMDVSKGMAETGNPNAASDAGVGAALRAGGGARGVPQRADERGGVGRQGLCGDASSAEAVAMVAEAERVEAEVMGKIV